MLKLTVIDDAGIQEIPFSPGPSVRTLLETAGIWIRCGCLGNGACGLCLIKIEDGVVKKPTKNECLLLSSGQLEKNIRLACRVIPEHDLRIRIVEKASAFSWQTLDPHYLSFSPSPHRLVSAAQRAGSGLGLAVDVGTTHMSVSLWDLSNEKRLGAQVGPNPQSGYGADVVTRLIAAGQSCETAEKLSQAPFESLKEAVREMSTHHRIDPLDIIRVTIVGNTSMLALLTQEDPEIILNPRSWTQPITCSRDITAYCTNILGIHPQAIVTVVQPLAGFIGSDLLAGVIATSLTKRPGELLIDFGTNSEMALWDGTTLWIASAAGGPAFESFETQCAMPADPGAIYQVDRLKKSGTLRFNVIGNRRAVGICGSGLVDLIAELLGCGELTPTGKMPRASTDGFVVQHTGPPIRLTLKDVDMFQRAKAGIGASVAQLLDRAHMSSRDIRRMYVCGIFGHYLNISNAQRIGLLPDIPVDRVHLCGNTALSGCEHMLLSRSGTRRENSIRQHTRIVNLTESPDFEKVFLNCLYLQRTSTQ
ncbi:MAG: ASKHA domain-containing protein [Endomicrobiales bacterium]|jgi:uncharacterized 2Fe-2S/4Fe-4S cluster protein (DUF4445 family)